MPTIGDLDKDGNRLRLGGYKASAWESPLGIFYLRDRLTLELYDVVEGEEKGLEAYNRLNGTKTKWFPPEKYLKTRIGGPRVLGEFESSSSKGVFYRVTINSNNEITCSCRGFTSHGHCWHYDTIIDLGGKTIKTPIRITLKDFEAWKNLKKTT